MPVVRNCIEVCSSKVSYSCDIQNVGNPPKALWQRYEQLAEIIKAYIAPEYQGFLTMPVHELDNFDKEEYIYWFTSNANKPPYARLDQLKSNNPSLYVEYKKMLDKTLAHYESVATTLLNQGKKNESEYLRKAIKHVGEFESMVFCLENKVIVAMWGMRPLNESAKDDVVISAQLIQPKNSYTITFNLDDKGFSSQPLKLHKFEHSIVGEPQIPNVEPKTGWLFMGWQPDPHNHKVEGDVVFVAQYEALNNKQFTLRFFDKDKRQIAQYEVPENTIPSKDIIPQLHPNCSWSPSPSMAVFGDVDYFEVENIQPTPDPLFRCHVRFLSENGDLLGEKFVEKGSCLKLEDLPKSGNVGYLWKEDILTTPILNDVDFVGKLPAKTFHKVRFFNDKKEQLGEKWVMEGNRLQQEDLPKSGNEDFVWEDGALESPIMHDTDLYALPPVKTFHRVRFLDEQGNVISSCNVPHGAFLTSSQIPNFDGKKVKWKVKPTQMPITKDMDFALTSRIGFPWFHWGSSFWKWLFRFLMFLLLVLLVLFVLYKCDPCSAQVRGIPFPIEEKPWIGTDPNVGHGGIYNPGNPYEPKPTDPEYAGTLPPNEGVMPPIDNAPIESNPGEPTIVANRLNIWMENEDKTIMEFAEAFTNKYPQDKYPIIYYDNVVKRIQIECPPEEREMLKADIPDQFAPEYQLFTFNETMYNGTLVPNDPDYAVASKSWHLRAIQMPQAWNITTGDSKLTVAIVDNGFNIRHPELASKVVMQYNVWSHDAKIFAQEEDHGTHVAGIALADMNNKTGCCGVAPGCMFMPVQVADKKGRMTVTSIVDGILYALYQGADVVNVSLGSEISGSLSPAEQRDLQDNHFKEEEYLWGKVMNIADRHNAVIVIAAGNENILAGVDPMNRPSNFIVVAAGENASSRFGKTDFSNYGEYADVTAPGKDIYSSVGRSGYAYFSGTSMASPVVAGLVALMKSVNKDLTAQEAKCILKTTGVSTDSKVGEYVQAYKALLKVQSGSYDDCHTRQLGEVPTPTTGDVQILLKWYNYNDLDLACKEPNGEVIYYSHRTSSTDGMLEIDMNVHNGDSRTPIENIYWPHGKAPRGNYAVYVKMYSQHESDITATPYTLQVKYGSQNKTISGSIDRVSDTWNQVFSFNLPI